MHRLKALGTEIKGAGQKLTERFSKEEKSPPTAASGTTTNARGVTTTPPSSSPKVSAAFESTSSSPSRSISVAPSLSTGYTASPLSSATLPYSGLPRPATSTPPIPPGKRPPPSGAPLPSPSASRGRLGGPNTPPYRTGTSTPSTTRPSTPLPPTPSVSTASIPSPSPAPYTPYTPPSVSARMASFTDGSSGSTPAPMVTSKFSPPKHQLSPAKHTVAPRGPVTASSSSTDTISAQISKRDQDAADAQFDLLMSQNKPKEAGDLLQAFAYKAELANRPDIASLYYVRVGHLWTQSPIPTHILHSSKIYRMAKRPDPTDANYYEALAVAAECKSNKLNFLKDKVTSPRLLSLSSSTLQGAISSLEQYLKSNPLDVDVALALHELQLEAGDYEKAPQTLGLNFADGTQCLPATELARLYDRKGDYWKYVLKIAKQPSNEMCWYHWNSAAASYEQAYNLHKEKIQYRESMNEALDKRDGFPEPS